MVVVVVAPGARALDFLVDQAVAPVKTMAPQSLILLPNHRLAHWVVKVLDSEEEIAYTVLPEYTYGQVVVVVPAQLVPTVQP